MDFVTKEHCDSSNDSSGGSVQETMATVLLEDGEASAGNRNRTRGRKTRFSCSDDLIIVREVAAAKAHIASFGEKGERFLQASVKANSNALFSWKITAQSLQDRYLKLQSEFDKRDNANRLFSGVGGECHTHRWRGLTSPVEEWQVTM
jgi:hypothetical protein